MSKASERALIVLFLHLEQMEKAGVPIAQSLEEARDETQQKKLRYALDGIVHEVRRGQPLHEAMSFYAKVFDETILGLVAVGEKAGKLARAFSLCREYVTKRDEHARLMRKATRQPKISVVIILILAAVRHETALPMAAISLSFFLALFIAARRLLQPFRYLSDRLFLMLPRVGTFIAEDSWARFAESLAMMFEAGIDLRTGIATAAEAAPNLVIREAIEAALPRIVKGASLHAAFRESKRMDSLALAMIKAGEDSGNLAHTLRELAEFYEKRTAATLTAMQQLTGPVLTIITGSILYLGL